MSAALLFWNSSFIYAMDKNTPDPLKKFDALAQIQEKKIVSREEIEETAEKFGVDLDSLTEGAAPVFRDIFRNLVESSILEIGDDDLHGFGEVEKLRTVLQFIRDFSALITEEREAKEEEITLLTENLARGFSWSKEEQQEFKEGINAWMQELHQRRERLANHQETIAEKEESLRQIERRQRHWYEKSEMGSYQGAPHVVGGALNVAGAVPHVVYSVPQLVFLAGILVMCLLTGGVAFLSAVVFLVPTVILGAVGAIPGFVAAMLAPILIPLRKEFCLKCKGDDEFIGSDKCETEEVRDIVSWIMQNISLGNDTFGLVNKTITTPTTFPLEYDASVGEDCVEGLYIVLGTFASCCALSLVCGGISALFCGKAAIWTALWAAILVAGETLCCGLRLPVDLATLSIAQIPGCFTHAASVTSQSFGKKIFLLPERLCALEGHFVKKRLEKLRCYEVLLKERVREQAESCPLFEKDVLKGLNAGSIEALDNLLVSLAGDNERTNLAVQRLLLPPPRKTIKEKKEKEKESDENPDSL